MVEKVSGWKISQFLYAKVEETLKWQGKLRIENYTFQNRTNTVICPNVNHQLLKRIITSNG